MAKTEFEILQDLEFFARAERERNHPFVNDRIGDAAARMRARMAYYQSVKEDLVALAGPRRQEALDLWTADVVYYKDVDGVERRYRSGISDMPLDQQKLEAYAQTLLTVGLVSREAVQRMHREGVFQFKEPEIEAALRAEHEENKRLVAAMQQILAAAAAHGGPYAREDALAAYNSLPGDMPSSWQKLDYWVENLVNEGLLPLTWLPGRRLGSLLDFLRKLIPTSHENKQNYPARENK